jgi:hypothetical protein
MLSTNQKDINAKFQRDEGGLGAVMKLQQGSKLQKLKTSQEKRKQLVNRERVRCSKLIKSPIDWCGPGKSLKSRPGNAAATTLVVNRPKLRSTATDSGLSFTFVYFWQRFYLFLGLLLLGILLWYPQTLS